MHAIPDRVLIPSVLLSTVAIMPMLVLELIKRRGMGEGFPVVLFATLWLLGLAFGVTLMTLLRRRRFSLVTVIGGVALLAIGFLYAGIVVDQLPCFLGVPNCD